MRPARVLVVGGTDSSGGAGIVADLRALATTGADAAVAVTAITVQTMDEVRAVDPVDAGIVSAQVDAALVEPVDAVKVGLLPTAELVVAVANALSSVAAPIVVDPVLRATSGHALAEGTADALRAHLLPLATVVTPNVDELATLTGLAVDDPAGVASAAGQLIDDGPAWVLATGGHLDLPEAVDLLTDGERLVELVGPRVRGSVRGTGCTFASLLASNLANGADDMITAARTAKRQLGEMLGSLVETPSGAARFQGG